MQRIELERKISRMVNRPVVLKDKGVNEHGTYNYASDFMVEPEGAHWFSAFVTEWGVCCEVFGLREDAHANYACNVHVRYHHGRQTGVGSNGVGYVLYLHRCGQWLTQQEIQVNFDQGAAHLGGTV